MLDPFISVYHECLRLLDEIEETILWEQLWIDLEDANQRWPLLDNVASFHRPVDL
jgi:hypothetical protein